MPWGGSQLPIKDITGQAVPMMTKDSAPWPLMLHSSAFLAGAADMATPAVAINRRWERKFYIGIAVVCAGVIFAGFSQTYFLRAFFHGPALRPLLELHGAVFTSWLVLLIAQTSLVAAKRTDIHRKLGVVGGVLAGLMVVVGYLVAIDAARRGAAPLAIPPLAFLAIPLGDIFVFAVLVAAALIYRRKPDTHKRLMVLATIGILAPGIARLPFAFISGPLQIYALVDVVLLICIAYDLFTRKRVHPAYIWGGLFLVLSEPLRLMLAGTHAWMVFAQWLTR